MLLCAGGAPALAFALRTVRPGGTVVVLGLSGLPAVPVDMDSVVVRDLAVHGVLGSPHVWPDTIELVRSGRVRTEPLVSGVYALGSMADALERLSEPGSMKVLIERRRSHAELGPSGPRKLSPPPLVTPSGRT